LATAAVLKDVIELYRAAGFDLVIVETAGIGQSDTEIVDLVDLSLYVMTSEYGAASQLEKIDMLDFADMVVLNKSEKRGAEDSLRDVRKQWRRNHPERATLPDSRVPVFPTIASRFNDAGVNRLFAALCSALSDKQIGTASWQVTDVGPTSVTCHEAVPICLSLRALQSAANSRLTPASLKRLAIVGKTGTLESGSVARSGWLRRHCLRTSRRLSSAPRFSLLLSTMKSA